MALKDLIKPASTPAADRPAGITCERYLRGEGKRCAHYVSNGACALPDELMCREWLKVNEPGLPPADPSPPLVAAPTPPALAEVHDLFGNLVPQVEAPPPKPKLTVPAAMPVPPTPEPSPIDLSRLRGFTTEDIDSFKALGVEVCLQSGEFGELWLVPAYTGQPRRELTPEHLATVLHALSVFPGSRVVAFNPPIKPGAARQEKS